jgi:Arc/MetJ family transcription regulator
MPIRMTAAMMRRIAIEFSGDSYLGWNLRSRFGLAGGKSELYGAPLLVPNEDAGELRMRTPIALDDNFVRTAQECTGLAGKSALVREALKALIEREAARRLADLDGTSARTVSIRRRKPNVGRIRRCVGPRVLTGH